jgi:carboxypeptidase family protein
MNRHMARALLVFAVMASMAVIGRAQSAAPRGSVKGSVTDSGGPVAGSRVVIKSEASSYTATATTDQKGEFTFSDTPVGGVEVKVYDAQGNMLVSGKGNVRFEGDVITLALHVP